MRRERGVPRRRRLMAGLALAVIALAPGCGAGNPPAVAPTSRSVSASPSASPSTPASCAERVLAAMSPGQRIGQLFIVGLREDRLGSAEISGIREHHFGSVSFIQTTTEGGSGVRAVADAVQALATKGTTGGVRFYVAANQEGGQIQALQGAGFSVMPTAVEQGKLAPATLRAEAAAWGAELAAAGVNLNFAPVMDVVPAGTEDQNEPIGVLEREFGTDPATVSRHGVAFLEGMAEAGVTSSAKHFPGLGRVEGNTDFTADVVDSVTTRDDPYLAPFRDAIDAGAPMVMVALATYTEIDPQTQAVFSPTVMRLLREDLGFDGVIVSDDIGAAVAIEDIPAGTRALDFLLAGGDLIISKYVEPADRMAAAIETRLASDAGLEARVNDAALRVLRAKEASGLLPCSG